MRIVYENRYTELDESDASEKKRFEVRDSVGGFGGEKSTVVEMLADISQKVMEMGLHDEESELEDDVGDMEIESIHDKFETKRKGWFR